MLESQALYGPDRSDLWFEAEVALGRQLMRLLPEDLFDAQPVIAGGGRFVLVADLRLDNRGELADALGVYGERLRRMSDSTLLALAYEKWEEECCDRLTGDFAFAAWDAVRRRLVLARDFAGGRPLHYHRCDRFVAVASMPKGLHALPDVPRAADCDYTLAGLLGRPPVGAATMFLGVSRVLPGQIVAFDRNGIAERHHWLPAKKLKPNRSLRDAADGLRHHLDEAVRAQLRGAERVGAHLSGGLDSSAVATSAALALEGKGSVVAFTAVPREGYEWRAPYGRIGDEGPAASATAALYPNMEHVLIRPGLRSPLADLDRDMFLLDQPAVNLCNMRWINAVNEEARSRGLRILLTGMRGNFAFSLQGLELLPDLLRRGRLVRLALEAMALRRSGYSTVTGAVSAALRPYLPFGAWSTLARLTGRGPLRWRHGAVNPGAVPKEGSLAPPPAGWSPREPIESRASAFRSVDLGNFQKGMLGGWGIDYRDPTADKKLVEYCLSLPPEAFLRNGVRRAAAREALRGRVPDAVLNDMRPGLQGMDWHEGAAADLPALREELARAAACAPAARLLDIGKLQQMVEEWPSDGWDRGATDQGYRLTLLRGISVAHFIRKASGANG
jgi:asparagine synthase (glutamine-hydrolysing)